LPGRPARDSVRPDSSFLAGAAVLPTFVIIGAAKCGTTSLHKYLSEHPEICMPQVKETNFFVAEMNYRRGLGWYESLFTKPAKACGDASPVYAQSWRFDGIPQRIPTTLPGARLIYVVRDPVERLVSHYKHLYAEGNETRPISVALADFSERSYINDSRYFRNLAPFLDVFPQEKVLILSADDLKHERQATLRRVFEFVGVDPAFTCPGLAREWHTTDAKFTTQKNFYNRFLPRKWLYSWLRKRWNPKLRPTPPAAELSDTLRRRLIEELRSDVQNFRRLTGQAFAEWCV
jgi:hypothetical protein